MAESIPFLDLNSPYRELKQELDEAYFRCMTSGWYVLGSEVTAFERAFANYCGTGHCIGVANGLDALHLTLRAYGIGPGDEVIVPSNTYIATWLAVTHAGALPVPAEPHLDTYNIDPEAVRNAITQRTRAVLAVHLYGQPADIDGIRAAIGDRDIKIIEDNAQAQGALYKQRRTGALGDAAGTSFYPGKNLGSFGDSGAVTTGDSALAERIRLTGNYGSREKYYNETVGFNSRLDELQAAFLRVKLLKLDEWNSRRRTIAAYYLNALSDIPGLTIPTVPSWAEPVWHLFVIRVERRDKVQQQLAASGVGTLIHYPIPPHLSQAYSDKSFSVGDFPIAETIAATVLSLPMGPHLSERDASTVVSRLKAILG